MHPAGRNYRNSSVIVDLAMGQIPRSTERISSYSIIKTRAFGLRRPLLRQIRSESTNLIQIRIYQNVTGT